MKDQFAEKYQKTISRLNEKQLEAVKYLSGPLLVLAGPGTGKTQLLSSKVAYILKETDTSPDNILCVTFTEAGCENMRDRLASIIGAASASKINIHTYHTLGIDILSAYKSYSESFDRKLDSVIDEVTEYKIISNLQNSLKASDILRGDNVSDIVDTLHSCKSNRLTPKDLETIANVNIEESKILSEIVSPLLEKVTKRKLHPSLEDVYQKISDILDSYDDESKILKNIEHTLISMKRDLKSAIDKAVEENTIKHLSDWQKKYFEKSETGSYHLKDRIANKKLLSLSYIFEKYENYLLENGLYDFGDMIECAISALTTDEGFRLSLEEKYQFILLDEFQDTNPSQFEIIRLLTNYESPLIMAVGDDDQAIYEFQGAKASNLSDFKKHYNSKVINLVENYRSTQDILDFSKSVIDQVEDSFAKTVPGIEKNLTAFFKDKKGEIARHEFLSSDGEYYWIADKIDSLKKSGVHERDIAIITPKYKYINDLLPYLHARNINIAYDQSEDIKKDIRISELITLGKFILSLAEGKGRLDLLPEVLSFPFWGLDHFEILDILAKARTDKVSSLSVLKNSQDEKIKNLSTFFADLAIKSFDAPLETILSIFLGVASLNGFTSPYLSYYEKNLDSFETFDLYEKLSVLRSLVTKRSLVSGASPKLKDLILLITDYEDAGKQITNTSPYQEADDSVSILSAHKSKGLEFEYVFIVSADHVAWGKGKGNNNHLVLPKNLEHIRHTGVTDGERLRLLFVAITRAKSNLYITNSLKDFSEKSPTRLEYLGEYEDDDKLISPYIKNDNEKIVIRHYLESDNIKRETNLSASWLDTYLTKNPDILSIYKSRVKNFRLSASALTSFIDIAYAGPKSFFKNVVLLAPREPKTVSIALGNVVHHTFEAITKTGLSDEEAINFSITDSEKEGLDKDDTKYLKEKAPEILSVALKSFGDVLRKAGSLAETDFYSENISLDGIPLVGKIDHMNIDEENKTIEIYDFKTSAYKSEKWDSTSSTLYKYRLQLCFYKLLLSLSNKYHNYKIKSGHILFVNPDKDGLVHDKVYEFNDKDDEELKFIIKTVYPHITSLDFLDSEELFIDNDTKRKLSDIKSFIKMLANYEEK